MSNGKSETMSSEGYSKTRQRYRERKRGRQDRGTISREEIKEILTQVLLVYQTFWASLDSTRT